MWTRRACPKQPCSLVIFFSRFYFDTTVVYLYFTGKSLSEALMFASTNPQYDDRLFIELHIQYMKIPSWKLGKTWCAHKLFWMSKQKQKTICVLPLFSLCNEQSVFMLWVSWCKHKSFWQRFTCKGNLIWNKSGEKN